jgi:hypothetical protein
MISELDNFKERILDIERNNTKFIIESRVKMKESEWSEHKEKMFNQAYSYQFDSYMKMVRLRDSILESDNIDKHEQCTLEIATAEYLLKYQKNLYEGLHVSLSGKRV